MRPQQSTILKFTNCNTVQELYGGQNESVKVDNLVIKPVYDTDEYLWLSSVLNKIKFDNIFVAKPVKSLYGNYIEDSFGAVPYFDALFDKEELPKKLEACRILNKQIAVVEKPLLIFEALNNPWKKAQSIAWDLRNEFEVNTIPDVLKQLLKIRLPIDLPVQLVHVDLAGNILIDKNNNLYIIDFTPGFYPKEYAEILLLLDSIAWYGASISNLENIHLEENSKIQLMIRALLFRLSVSLFTDRIELEKLKLFEKNFQAYKPVISRLLTRE